MPQSTYLRGKCLFLLPMRLDFKTIKILWITSFKNKKFNRLFFAGLPLLICILLLYPIFFNLIEQRNGFQINDFVLNKLPSYNLSIPIFVVIWGSSLIMLFEAFKNPKIFIYLLWSFIMLSISRVLSIGLVPLNPPQNLIPLIDPISNSFYGGKFLTKDLFYSGHTATQFMFYFILEKKWQKTIVLIASILIGTMVLLQHVHYTIDVIFAFLFVPLITSLTKKYITN